MDASQRLSAKQALQHPWLKVSPRKRTPCAACHVLAIMACSASCGQHDPGSIPSALLWHACSTALPAGAVKQPLHGCVVTLSSAQLLKPLQGHAAATQLPPAARENMREMSSRRASMRQSFQQTAPSESATLQ